MSNRRQYFKVCFCCKFVFRLNIAEPPQDVKMLFETYKGPEEEVMGADQLQRFLVEVQGEEGATREDAQAIINSVRHLNIIFHHKGGMRLESFFRYLLGDYNPPLNPSLGVHHEMDAPLSHYYLFTGHNSYLTGNQLYGKCSVKPIIRALERGVRVIELDLWPNSRNDKVIVCHGGTLTSPVDLIKCLKAINEHAFTASEYPLVITFEDHLTPILQAKVVDMVTKTFGDKLFCPQDELKELPSPSSLKRRIIISTKPPEFRESQAKDKHTKTNEMVKIQEELDDQDEEPLTQVPQYRRLIAIHAGKPKGGKQNLFSEDPNIARRISLSEQDLKDAVKAEGQDIIRFTHRNLVRVYPKGVRVDSSNYDPLVAWSHGAQMVAFNMQGYGKYLWIMQGMFRANGGCGYVKKPDFLLRNEGFDPDMSMSMPIKLEFKVKLYMGEGWHLDFHRTHFDLYSPPDFFTKIGIVGLEGDKEMKRTKTINNSWIPMWNEDFEFVLKVPELALLRVGVFDYDPSGKNDFGGQTCLPLLEIRPGYRSVPLYDEKGEQYKHVKLLMHFSFNWV
ncbi:phosphoinositide phospholipase C 2-like [Impatiens glandulifera]|uniref:phosphoinositide phospholipase C 2-like n=1 Tax=Impatiens glandulifera TaxID=253017 RepID=UPI001FB0E092|nr:phosphoinositide phospholipase C 2-like [Impatiens glandulifera]